MIWILVGLVASITHATKITTSSQNSNTCAPLYGSSFWNSKPALINVRLETVEDSKAPFGYIIYEFHDGDQIGVINPADKAKNYFCTPDIYGTPGCDEKSLGKPLFSNDLVSEKVSAKWGDSVSRAEGLLSVRQTGYYCVRVINPTGTAVRIITDFQNPYGRLPAEYRPLMNLSLFLALIYLASSALWALLLLRHSRITASFQKYVGAMFGLSFLEMAAYHMFYSWYNTSGSASVVLLGVAAVVGATRMTAALFILLIVSMGYGTVLPSLEDRAKPIYGLSAFYLVASVVNVLTSMSTRTSGQLLLLLSTLGVILGSAAYLTWTFDSLKTTIAILLQRKQYAKLEMYYKLTALLKALYTATILCMIGSIFFVAGSSSSQAWYAGHWNWLWLMTDGWQSLLNLVACLGAAYIFRPRRGNRTHDMNELSSEPLPDDEDGGQDDVESGNKTSSAIDMQAYKKYEAKQRQQSELHTESYQRLEDPDWARPEDPFQN